MLRFMSSSSSAVVKKRARIAPIVQAQLGGGGSKVWSEITELARLPSIVADLGQGYPDFNGALPAREAAARAIESDARLNQYSLVNGSLALRQSLANFYQTAYPAAAAAPLDANTEVVITTSGTEALYAAISTLVAEGDEVITFLPSFPWYSPHVRLARGMLKHVTLKFPTFALPTEEELRQQFSSQTKLVIVNSPHNPTGHVLTRAECELIAKLCVEYDTYCIADEVYEQFLFNEGAEHLRLCDFPGMRERTLTVGSASKMFSLTGWRVGWLYGPADLIAAAKTLHSFASYCAPTPLQEGVRAAFDAATLERKTRSEHNALFARNAERLADALQRALGVKSALPEGGYFLVCDVSSTGKTDVEFCAFLAKERGVVAVPMSVFYEGGGASPINHLVRFAICKTEAVIDRAVAAILQN